jgi:hypothetical protein
MFVLRGDGDLVELTESAYATEDQLQTLVERHPALLAGDQMGSDVIRRWLLVRREAAIAEDEDRPGRWAVDHVFLDQDAVPTLVEVKRSTDTRIRREMVGQMLDYASHAVATWTADGLRAEFEATCRERSVDPDDAIASLLESGDEVDADAFWQDVGTNLEAGRIRMLFVADAIPREVHRVVEFLNDQMTPAEVLAVEVKQYRGAAGDLQTMVPRVVGQTVKARQRKASRSGGPARTWDEATFMQKLAETSPSEAVEGARRILAAAEARGLQRGYGHGRENGSIRLNVDVAGKQTAAVFLWTYDVVGFPFDRYRNMPGLRDVATRRALASRFERIAGVRIEDDKLDGGPSTNLHVFADEANVEALMDAIDWFARAVNGEAIDDIDD